jgi:hypothetical protein
MAVLDILAPTVIQPTQMNSDHPLDLLPTRYHMKQEVQLFQTTMTGWMTSPMAVL